jgi:hypothetical protein
VPASGLSVLVILYYADYIGNKMWGNNVTYDLASQYIFLGRSLSKELQLLSRNVYLMLVISIVIIFTIHLLLSGEFFRSLEELCLPGRELSLFRDRDVRGCRARYYSLARSSSV